MLYLQVRLQEMFEKSGTVGVPHDCKKGFVWKPDVPPASEILAKDRVARPTGTPEVTGKVMTARRQAIVSLVRPVKLEATRHRPGHPGSQSGEIITQTPENLATPRKPGRDRRSVGKTMTG